MTKSIFKRVLIVFLTLICYSRSDAQGVIVSVAGKTEGGFIGNDVPADSCLLHWPEAIAIDDSGNKFIADALNNVIRKIHFLTGKITTVAGTGFAAGTGLGGYGGDGGPATAARLHYPSGIAVDATHNLYIADQRNNRIRKVDTAGVITTIAGNGFIGFGGDGAAAISAVLYHPTRVALDATGNIYIADSGNNRIRRIDATGVIYSIAGNGSKAFSGDGSIATNAGLFNPMDMAVDATGNMFIADYVNNRIRKVDAAGTISTYAGIGIPGYSGDSAAATAANIYQPSGIVLDAAGNLYFSDLANARVRKIDASGIITTIAGNGVHTFGGDNGPALDASMWFPQGLALDSRGQVYFADKGNNRIRMISGVLSIKKMEDDQATLRLFPNPTQGAFTLNISSVIDEDVHVTITNVAGVKVADFKAQTNKPVLVGSDVKFDAVPGMYFLSAVTAHKMLNEKVIVR